jgi:cell division protein FtsA
MARQTLAAVVEPRYEELFSLVQAELDRSGYGEHLAAGVVMTGGSARIEGAVQLAESIFHLPVRIGMPQSLKLGGMEELLQNPIYATGIGLLMYGRQRSLENGVSSKPRQGHGATKGLGEAMGKLKGWFANNF